MSLSKIVPLLQFTHFWIKHELRHQSSRFNIYSRLINALRPGSVKKINTMKMPFKQRENIELYLKGAADYGLKEQDLFQVSLDIRIESPESK